MQKHSARSLGKALPGGLVTRLPEFWHGPGTYTADADCDVDVFVWGGGGSGAILTGSGGGTIVAGAGGAFALKRVRLLRGQQIVAAVGAGGRPAYGLSAGTLPGQAGDQSKVTLPNGSEIIAGGGPGGPNSGEVIPAAVATGGDENASGGLGGRSNGASGNPGSGTHGGKGGASSNSNPAGGGGAGGPSSLTPPEKAGAGGSFVDVGSTTIVPHGKKPGGGGGAYTTSSGTYGSTGADGAVTLVIYK